MKDFPIRNIFLPAALAASAVFSAFTLPTALQRSTTHAVDLPLVTQKSQMGLGQVHKDIAIPYIGTVIVFSAGAGIATAELVRKWRAARLVAAQQAQQEAEYVKAEAEAEAELTTPGETEGQTTIFPLTDADFIWPTSESEAEMVHQTTAFSLVDPDIAWPTSEFAEAEAEVAVTAEVAMTEQRMANQMLSHQVTKSTCWAKHSVAEPEELAEDMTVIIFPGQYQRCRIQVPHLREQLYAIEFDERFYSLLTAGISKDQALAAITQLAKEERPAILTQMNEGHAVWVLEPQAKRVRVA